MKVKDLIIEEPINKLLGKTRTTAMMQHSFYKDYIYSPFEAPQFKHSVDNFGDHVVEASTKQKMVRFHFSKSKVGEVHLFHKKNTKWGDEWQWVKSAGGDN